MLPDRTKRYIHKSTPSLSAPEEQTRQHVVDGTSTLVLGLKYRPFFIVRRSGWQSTHGAVRPTQASAEGRVEHAVRHRTIGRLVLLFSLNMASHDCCDHANSTPTRSGRQSTWSHFFAPSLRDAWPFTPLMKSNVLVGRPRQMVKQRRRSAYHIGASKSFGSSLGLSGCVRAR